ncbi:MAG: helix-turn-helix transcriptional regulator [Ruminococcaceae bacterium]|nr:helix-turn-helix transcriptional regulator [Oscillospiraceae bacterium]
MDTFDRIELLMNQKGVTAYRVAKDTGLSTGLFSQWKKRMQKPSMDKLNKLADYFGVSVDYLSGNEQKEKPAQSVQVRDEHDNIVVLDDETRDLIDSLRTKPEMKMLFSVSKGATKEDIIKTIKIIEALKDKGEEGDN